MTLYTNAKGVHGGCYKVAGGCGWVNDKNTN
jgi:hypothetical protein